MSAVLELYFISILIIYPIFKELSLWDILSYFFGYTLNNFSYFNFVLIVK